MGVPIRSGTVVVDEAGIRHQLTAELAGGGQGMVWRTSADGVVVKITNDPRDEVRERIRAVSRLDLGGLPVAAPRSLLAAPWSGYVMDLVTGVEAIGLLGHVGQGGLVGPAAEPSPVAWFGETGGVRRRLGVLASTFVVLSSLHARGLVYGDISGGNVLVSNNAERSRAYLVDTDNITVRGEKGAPFWTPPFGAPEVMRSGSTTSSDAFSAMVLAYGLLTMANPFYGEVLDDMAPADLGNDVWANLAPYVNHPTDRTNDPVRQLDPSRVVPPRLLQMLSTVFCSPLDLDRPSAASLAAAARSGLAALVTCECGWDGFVSDPACYACDQPRNAAAIRVMEDQGDGTWAPYGRTPVIGVVPSRSTRLAGSDLGFSTVDQDMLSVGLEDGDLHAVSTSSRITVARVASDVVAVERDRRTPLHLAV